MAVIGVLHSLVPPMACGCNTIWAVSVSETGSPRCRLFCSATRITALALVPRHFPVPLLLYLTWMAPENMRMRHPALQVGRVPPGEAGGQGGRKWLCDRHAAGVLRVCLRRSLHHQL